MDLAWLEDFTALASNGNFSRAANLRNVTQPAFSRRIRMLEEWVGTTLFDRSVQPVTLTEAGEEFRSHAEEITAQLKEARRTSMAAGERSLKALSFAATHVLSLNFFPRWLAAMGPADPTTTVNLASGNTSHCEQSLLQGEAHFLVCHCGKNMRFARISDDTHESKVLKRDRLVPMARADLNGEPLHHLDRPIDSTPVLLYRPTGGLGRVLRSAIDVDNLPSRLQVVGESHMALLLAMVLEGRGIAWLPESFIEVSPERDSLAVAGLEDWFVDADIRIYRNRERLGRTAESFWDSVAPIPADERA